MRPLGTSTTNRPNAPAQDDDYDDDDEEEEEELLYLLWKATYSTNINQTRG
jgi:hypothetical protein